MIDLVIEPAARTSAISRSAGSCPTPSAWSGPSSSSTTWARPTFEPGFPRSVDVRPHPHIGLSTLSYLFEGEMTHRDSVGSLIGHQAGRGELDDRRARHHPFRALRGPARPRRRMDGIQAWIALPEE
jgi:redox-sensitive bicupin YhaK (pirin superfamily)